MKLWNYLIVIVAVLSAPSCLYTQWGDETEKKPGQESQAADATADTETKSDSDGKDGDDKAEDDKKKREKEDRIRDLTHELEVARAKMNKTRKSAENSQIDAEVEVHHAEFESSVAQAKLELFQGREMPIRLERTELNLQAARDRSKEAAEELEQIEIMYRDQDLNDETAEFVISRGRRSAERAAGYLALQEEESKILREHTLARELRQMEMDVERKKDSVRRKRNGMEMGQMSREIELMNSEFELMKLEEKLARAKEEE